MFRTICLLMFAHTHSQTTRIIIAPIDRCRPVCIASNIPVPIQVVITSSILKGVNTSPTVTALLSLYILAV